MWCRAADESAVVMNLQPMKAGNGPEGKTGGTAAKETPGVSGQKRLRLRRDEGKPKCATDESSKCGRR